MRFIPSFHRLGRGKKYGIQAKNSCANWVAIGRISRFTLKSAGIREQEISR